MKTIPILFALLIAASSISIAVNSQTERCMVVYSIDPEDYLKIDMRFQKFIGQTDSEYYLITLYNTETHQVESFNVTEGTFRREIQLTEQVIYRLCVKIVLNRYGSGEIQKFIEYNSGVQRHTDAESTIQIPQNLLKIKDLQSTYTEVIRMIRSIKYINEKASELKKEQDEQFLVQNEKIKEIEWITIIEFAAITVFGVYQYFRLRNIIDNKQRG